jgi:hypothetical protein
MFNEFCFFQSCHMSSENKYNYNKFKQDFKVTINNHLKTEVDSISEMLCIPTQWKVDIGPAFGCWHGVEVCLLLTFQGPCCLCHQHWRKEGQELASLYWDQVTGVAHLESGIRRWERGLYSSQWVWAVCGAAGKLGQERGKTNYQPF